MNIHPKLATKADDLKKLTYKAMKSFVKKDLLRLQKSATADKPVPVMLIGDYAYPDKEKGAALMLVGTWKGDFKKFAKETVTLHCPTPATMIQ